MVNELLFDNFVHCLARSDFLTSACGSASESYLDPNCYLFQECWSFGCDSVFAQ
jgi:hypothetical protein